MKIIFKPLAEVDLTLLCTWLMKPHVKEWWDDQLTENEIKQKYGERIDDDVVRPFIIYIDDKPIGFIQSYLADKVGEGWWPDALPGTIGIDQFIGEENYLNRGLGTLIIREFIKTLFADSNINKIITDVDPNNYRAYRCYEKVGFQFVKEVMTPDGLAHLLELHR